MRVLKEPEVRKQEIIHMAMKVFARKGYEAATMKDIAREAKVVPGLCYHYFKNKQELYQEAVWQYARECSQAFVAVFRQTDLSLEECLKQLETVQMKQDGTYKYKEFFDQEGNQLFHRQLEFHMAKEIFPYMEAYLTGLAQRGELQTKNPYLLARFIWGGQMEVMNEETISLSDRIAFLKEIIYKLMKN